MVELDRLRIATRKIEENELETNGGNDPDIIVERASNHLGGVTVKIIKANQINLVQSGQT